jgi:hypothetical protein
MSPKLRLINILSIAVLMLAFLPKAAFTLGSGVQTVKASSARRPVVAIHVSEWTQALETLPAVAPVPSGSGFSGYSWFYTSWHYSTIYESLKIALESDGTLYQVVTDADIAAGALLEEGSPKYPILFSLASEAVADNEIQPLRDYVSAGGFLFAGSSAFTRRPDGVTRGNFALANEMGLKMVNRSLQNWTPNTSFTHWNDHRLVNHIPLGTVDWNMLSSADEVVWGTAGAQQLWQTVAQGAEVIATGGNLPLLATKTYGSGRFIYHAIFNPIVGAGGPDSGMYAYTIYRNAIEWAFEAANLPLIKRSPWPYEYDAAFMMRHDFENSLSSVEDIENSAKYEQSIGVKGDYYFCTGILRTLKSDARQPVIDSLRRAVADYAATIGPHNGGYPNPGVPNPWLYDYWHWGPDTMLDRTVFGPPYAQYTNGYAYAKDSIRMAYEDIEGWLKDLDNGRVGCGAAGDCPRTWVSPYFNSGRERSLKMLTELDAIVMGEQKISPFPHWTLSNDPATNSHRYPTLALPVSDWYVNSKIAQSIESGHTTASVLALVDFYYQKGYLLDLYSHGGTESGLTKEYANYAAGKPRIWSINSVGLYDWWVKRDRLTVTPGFSRSGDTAIASAAISGAEDERAAIEMSLPYWNGSPAPDLEVRLNGKLADASQYRLTNYGVKVWVGMAISQVEVRYAPLESWSDTIWTQSTWNDPAQTSGAGSHVGQSAPVSRSVVSSSMPLFLDNFNWFIPGLTPDSGVYDTMGGVLNAHAPEGAMFGYAYKKTPIQPTGDYSIEVDIRFPNPGSYCGGIVGRLNPVTGQRYAVWVCPGTSILRLIRFTDWTHWGGQDLTSDVRIPTVGSGWHHIKMTIAGSRIQVFYDRSVTSNFNITDPTFKSGYAGLDFWADTNLFGPSYNNFSISDLQGIVLAKDDFGPDPVIPDLQFPWSIY